MKISFLYSNHYLAHMTAQPGIAFKLANFCLDSNINVQIISNDNGQVSVKPEHMEITLLRGDGSANTYIRNIGPFIVALKRFKPDCIHVHGNLFFVFLISLQSIIQIPVTVYVGETLDIHTTFLRKIFVIALKRAKHIFVSNNFIANQLRSEGIEQGKISVVRLGLESKFLTVASKNNKPIDVLFFGDCRKTRGFDIFVETAKKLPHLSFVALLRYKTGDCEESLEQAKKLKNMSLRFQPYRQSMEKILVNAKIIFLPFRWMGVRPPLTIVEGMAVGSCVITSSLGGTDELIRHGKNGFMYHHTQINSFVSKIDALSKSPAIRKTVGIQARKDIGALYSSTEYGKIVSHITS